MSAYDDLIHGVATEEPHCEFCGAVDRYCPGHTGDVELLSLRGGMTRMMPVDPGTSGREGFEGRAADDAHRGSVGYFIGDPVAVWAPDGERMILEKEFAYVDPRAKRWSAPRGAILDGASIPRALWTVIGSPYRGKYRYASIIHDYHCNARVEVWDSVHLVFYHACLAGGTGKTLAKLCYYGVYHFGPRWGYRSPRGYVPIARGRAVDLPKVRVEAIERFIVDNNPSLDELRIVEPSDLGITFRNAT